MAITRKYSGKDVDMLSTCAIIIEQAIIHKTFLVSKRATWADPFFPDLQTQIEDAFTGYLGIDNAKAMRQATRIVIELQAIALDLLAEFKIQIVEDFKNDPPRRDEILTQLGFTTHHKGAQNKDQEALIELLLKFKLNMTNGLKTEITNKGLAMQTITDIIAHADILKEANITQETLKGRRKEITQEAVTEFNVIYTKIISIARISYKFYKKDTAIRDQFSYSKTKRNLNKPKPIKPTIPPIPTP